MILVRCIVQKVFLIVNHVQIINAKIFTIIILLSCFYIFICVYIGTTFTIAEISALHFVRKALVFIRLASAFFAITCNKFKNSIWCWFVCLPLDLKFLFIFFPNHSHWDLVVFYQQ